MIDFSSDESIVKTLFFLVPYMIYIYLLSRNCHSACGTVSTPSLLIYCNYFKCNFQAGETGIILQKIENDVTNNASIQIDLAMYNLQETPAPVRNENINTNISQDNLFMIRFQLLNKFQQFSQQLLHQTVEFNACGFFSVDYTMLFTVYTIFSLY